MHRLAPLAALLLAVTGCPAGGPTGGPAGDLDAIKARGRLVVAMDVGYDPFETLGPDGKPQGFDVDLVHEVAADLGVQVELKNVAWDGIVGELQTGKVDVIFSGMSITEDRQRAVAFSEPYYRVGQVVVKKKGDGRIKSFRDLDDPQMRVATQQGTTGEQAIREFMPKAQLMKFAKTDEACLTLIQGKCDAVVFDHPFLLKYVTEQTTELEGLWQPFTEEAIAAAVRLDNQRLVDAINATLARLRQSGRLAQLEARWFPRLPDAQ
ncbi:MAG: transporter substrate-binding domain-containing protein [Planctomycetes bacterium]|nr:transporter substrate-binding domain-containing protein [Planctomycetota bacterium]